MNFKYNHTIRDDDAANVMVMGLIPHHHSCPLYKNLLNKYITTFHIFKRQCTKINLLSHGNTECFH